MSKITYKFQIGKYRVLKIEPFTEFPYKKIRIGNEIFTPVPTYDMPNCVSIEYTGRCSFLNSNIEFIGYLDYFRS